jgi:hypothetical protein
MIQFGQPVSMFGLKCQHSHLWLENLRSVTGETRAWLDGASLDCYVAQVVDCGVGGFRDADLPMERLSLLQSQKEKSTNSEMNLLVGGDGDFAAGDCRVR